MKKFWLISYFVIAGCEVFAEHTSNEMLRAFSKPLLMLILMAFYLSNLNSKPNLFDRFILGAFAFSWVGDVALMFVNDEANINSTLLGIAKNPNYFLVGLVGFLIAHLLYAFAFSKINYPTKKALLPSKIYVLIPLVLYMVGFLSLLLPTIHSNLKTAPFEIPVIIYSLAIATMVLFAINRFGRVSDKSFAFVFGGALLFMFSDSLIAVNKFLFNGNLFLASESIMILYILGQFFIAKGCLKQTNDALHTC